MGKTKIITFEGINASAKEAHAALLSESLQQLGYKVRRLSFPRLQTPIGAVIGMWLRCEIDLDERAVGKLFEADLLDFQREARELAKGNADFVIIDHYQLSNYSFFYSKDLPLSWLLTVKELGIKPHVTFFLSAPGDDNNSSLRGVQEAYLANAPGISDAVHVLDCEGSVEEVHRSILLIAQDSFLKR